MAEDLLRQWRKKPLSLLAGEEPLSALKSNPMWRILHWGEAELEQLLPHRSPFLLCRKLCGFAPVGLENSPPGLLWGQSYLAPEDPIFKGHFPDFPIYPGVLQIEMLGQLGLCLGYFQELYKNAGPEDIAPSRLNIRASKILGAHYLAPVLPGQTVDLLACQVGQNNGFFASMLGQLLVGTQVAMVCVLEVCFVD
ncbi:MAG: 3-hydroxyacyl-ACP dehydratase FabZ family protein [Spirochaetota bacterium]